MQVLQAGAHKLLLLELDPDLVMNIAKQAGFESRLTDTRRALVADLTPAESKAPLLLFDASDPSNLGWFSRCQFYVDGSTGNVLQTPLQVANQRDRNGRTVPHTLRIQIFKELPQNFRMPGKQPVTEQSVYNVLYNFLQALMHVGVGLCGSGVVRPLTGRVEGPASRN